MAGINTLKALEIKKFEIVELDKIDLAPWNYKTEDEDKAAALERSLRNNGQILNINIRIKKDKRFEVIDGNHRVVALKNLGAKQCIAYNHGEISVEEAEIIALALNENHFENDMLKLAGVVHNLSKHYEPDELANLLPYTQDIIQRMIDLINFNVNQFKNNANDNEDREFELKKYAATLEQAITIDRAIVGVRGDEKMSDGRALELVCADYLAGVAEVEEDENEA